MGAAGLATERADRAIDRAAASATSASSSFSRLQRAATTTGRAMRNIGSMSMTAFTMAGRGARALYGQLTSIQSLLLGAGAGYAGIYRPLQLASEAEQAQIAFETMLGSAEKASQFIGELEQFAKDTPFDVPQMRDNARMLMAFGFEAERVLPMMEALGNASAGLGSGAEGIERMARAMGQIRAKGRLQGEEALQLMEAGIPVLEIMAEATGLSTAAIQDEMSKGLIPAEAAINILIDGMNRRFPDMMDKQADSMAGLWAQITETFDTDILRKWGQGIASELRPRLKSLNSWIESNGDTIDRWGMALQRAAGQATDWLMTRFERAFTYISDNFINNPEFNDLTFTGKVGYAFEKLKDAYNRWYEGGGKQDIANVSKSLTNALANGISTAAPAIGKAALDIGKEIGSGVFRGIEEWAKKNPLQAAMLGGLVGGLIGGLPGVAIGAAAFAGAPQVKSIFEDKAAQREANAFHDALKRIEEHEGDEPVFGYGTISVPPNRRHKRGLNYVPYDGYVAQLHRGEAVLTAPEAREYRSGGGGGGGLVINGDIIVNSGGAGSERYDAMKFLREINRQLAPMLPN